MSLLHELFCGVIQGGRGFMMDTALFQHTIGKVREGTQYRVVIPLMGRSKGGTGIKNHLQVVVNDTASNLKVR